MLRWGLILALALLALDQVTKALIVANIPESTAGNVVSHPITAFFNIWHVRNSGIAFSIGNFGDGGRYAIGSLAIVVAFGLFWIGRRAKANILIAAYAMIAGGALGNAFDRLNPARKTVVDFLDFHLDQAPQSIAQFSYSIFGTTHFPSFNVADTAIFLGVALILIDMLFFAEKREKLETE